MAYTVVGSAPLLASIRYCFTSKLYYGSPPSCSRFPSAKPTLLQYYCTTIAQYMPNHRPPFLIGVSSRRARVCAGVGGVFSVGVSCVRVTCWSFYLVNPRLAAGRRPRPRSPGCRASRLRARALQDNAISNMVRYMFSIQGVDGKPKKCAIEYRVGDEGGSGVFKQRDACRKYYWFVHKHLGVNEYLVKVNFRRVGTWAAWVGTSVPSRRGAAGPSRRRRRRTS